MGGENVVWNAALIMRKMAGLAISRCLPWIISRYTLGTHPSSHYLRQSALTC